MSEVKGGKVDKLRTKYAGLEFKNPLVQASGNLGLSFSSLKRGIEFGAGAVTVKSAWVGEFPRRVEIHPLPTMAFMQKQFKMPRTMQNWGGVFISMEKELELSKALKSIAQENDCRLIGSLTADEEKLEHVKDFGKAARQIQDAGAELLEIVVSCPYLCESAAEQLDLDRKLVSILFTEVLGAVSIPVIAKIAYEYHTYLMEQLKTLKELGVKYIHSFTRTRGTVIDIERGMPFVPGPSSLVYGALRKPGSNRAAAFVRDYDKDFEVISSGGVWTTPDAIERLMCGADLVAIHTAVNYHGQALFPKLADGISEFLDRKNYKLNDIVGVAVPHIVDQGEYWRYKESLDRPKSAITPVVNMEKCTRCSLCTNCIFGAWEMKDDNLVLDMKLCERCGICESICPVDAITMQES
ncbi:4Fe-4S binding protein [Chloroflexota bacterium]